MHCNPITTTPQPHSPLRRRLHCYPTRTSPAINSTCDRLGQAMDQLAAAADELRSRAPSAEMAGDVTLAVLALNYTAQVRERLAGRVQR